MIRLDDHRDPDHVWAVLGAASGNLAIDCGANIGQAARVLALHFDRVVSLEPCLESYEILAAETPPNVEALPYAVSSVAGEVKLSETNSVGTGQLTTGTGLHWGPVLRWRSVPALTLDHLTAIYGPPDFVKVDTEGHELAVVEGGEETFCTHRPEVLIECHRREFEVPIRRHLAHYVLEKLTGGEHWPIDHFWIHGRARGRSN